MKISALLSVCVLAAAEEIQTGESLSLLQTAAKVQSHSFGKDECKAAKADAKAARAALKLARATFKSQRKAWKDTKAAQEEACGAPSDDDASDEAEATGVQPAGKPTPKVVMVYTEVTTETPNAITDNRGDAKLAPNSNYAVSFEILRNDLGSGKPAEYVTDVVVGETSLGECAPDGGDYDCTFFECDFGSKVINSGSTGNVPLNVKITGHSWDCDCDKLSWECSKQDTVAGRAKMTAVGRFSFTPA